MPCYFISGHLDLSEKDFFTYYVPLIHKALEDKDKAYFVIGDAKGVDMMAQNYLDNYCLTCPELFERITIYHMGVKPRYNCGFITIGGFKTDDERDSAMTMISQHDILYVRSEEECRNLYGKKYKSGRISGTERNRMRRNKH